MFISEQVGGLTVIYCGCGWVCASPHANFLVWLTLRVHKCRGRAVDGRWPAVEGQKKPAREAAPAGERREA